MNYPYTCDGMLTIELHAPVTSLEPTLTKSQASGLTQLIAKDLNAVLKVSSQSALVVCGAAFAADQLMQPKFPVQDSITQYASAAFQGQLNNDQILSIGANDGFMPQGLQPKPNAQNLLHLPFCLYTHDLDLAERFEAELMHKGMVAPPTYQYLCDTFSTTINHANYMTYLDLVAMMHNHYEQMGLTHLWQVIETALVSKAPKTAVQSHTNNHFFLVDHLLFTPFFTWQQFQEYFKADHSEYINWLMAQRLSMAAFSAHGLETKTFIAGKWPLDEAKICLGEFEKNLIIGDFWTDTHSFNDNTDLSDNVSVTYLNHPQAGTVAITVEHHANKSQTHYPINNSGPKAIERMIKQQIGDDFEAITRAFVPEHNQ